MKPKPTSIRIEKELKEALKKKAKKEGRSLSGHMIFILDKHGK